jgi:hypothetical protein
LHELESFRRHDDVGRKRASAGSLAISTVAVLHHHGFGCGFVANRAARASAGERSGDFGHGDSWMVDDFRWWVRSFVRWFEDATKKRVTSGHILRTFFRILIGVGLETPTVFYPPVPALSGNTNGVSSSSPGLHRAAGLPWVSPPNGTTLQGLNQSHATNRGWRLSRWIQPLQG